MRNWYAKSSPLQLPSYVNYSACVRIVSNTFVIEADIFYNWLYLQSQVTSMNIGFLPTIGYLLVTSRQHMNIGYLLVHTCDGFLWLHYTMYPCIYTAIYLSLPCIDIGNLKKQQFLCSPGLYSNIAADDKNSSSVLDFHNINFEHLLILRIDFSYVDNDFQIQKLTASYRQSDC